MFMAVFLRAEVTFRFHGLPTLWTDGSSTLDDFLAPTGHGPRLGACAPETNGCSFFRVIAIHYDFARDNNNQVTVFIVAKPNFSRAEDWLYRRIDAHLFIKEI